MGPITWKGLSRWQQWIFALLILYSLIHLAYSVAVYNPISSPRISGDFYVSYLEATHWRETGQMKLLGSTNVPYPLFYHWWLFPLTLLPYPPLSAFLYLTQFFLFAWALALLVRAAAPDSAVRPMAYLAAVLMAVNFQPFLETLSQHKPEGLEFFLLCAAILAFREGKAAKSGTAIFAAAALKYMPAFLAFYFFIKREMRVVKAFLLTAALCTAAFTLSFGIHALRDFGVRQMIYIAFNRKVESNLLVANFEWQSLSEIVNRLFARADPAHPLGESLLYSQSILLNYPRAALALGLALKLLFLGAFIWFVRRRGCPVPKDSQAPGWTPILLEISLALVMIPIVVQAFRVHYAILLLPAFVLTGLLLLRRLEQTKMREKILFGAAFTLSGMLIPGGLLNRLPPHPFWGGSYARLYQWWSFPFYGYLLLGASILLLHKRLRDELPQK